MSRAGIATALAALFTCARAGAEGLRDYNAIGVGERAGGLLHARAGAADVDLSTAEASVALRLPAGATLNAGYQYGGFAFAGISRRKLSLRFGVAPDKRSLGAGLGYGAPLLPLPVVVASSVARCYVGIAGAGLDPRIFDVLTSDSGPLGDAVSGGPAMPFGFGAQIIALPEAREITVFVGLQTGL